MTEELALSVSLARQAGREIMRWFGGSFAVERKSDDSLVTPADHAADELIRAGIAAKFPADAILSEETADDVVRLSSERLWLVDPLDGTKHFAAGRKEFAVMIGLAFRGRPVVGVVHLPAEGVTYLGEVGWGAFRESAAEGRRPLEIRPAVPDARDIVAVVSHVGRHGRTARAIEALGAGEVIRSGSVGRKAMMVAEGRADAYLTASRHSRHWDSCAPEAIVRAAGGTFLEGRGRPIRYNTAETRNLYGLFACRPGLEARLVRALLAAEEVP
ncbi:MAG: 3'(2'),5'-bisphosphate nucleotidase CysQ [Acidobacteria bacterium]|nr:MAG: 3'(2'),5'-bisphosphate nucleotidase CysQ [Acidobacteriota bacterium]